MGFDSSRSVQTNMTYLKTLDANSVGRDFVVGDLHGALQLLDKALDHVNFDTTKDRLISVGDLIDRGPDSFKCLDLLHKPWFHSVMANHEELLLEGLQNPHIYKIWMYNGGDWFHALSQQEKDEVLHVHVPKLRELPYIITVKGAKKFHVIHAEFYDTVSDDILANPLSDEFLRLVGKQCMEGNSLTWGRELYAASSHTVLDGRTLAKVQRRVELGKLLDIFDPNISDIYCGHTPQFAPHRIGPCVNIDTGAVFSLRKPDHNYYGLTLAQPLTNTFWKATPNGVIKL